jgi:hypothetical protein
MMWFEVGIEGKDPMDHKEEEWGGTIQFGFKDKKFSQEVEDYFLHLRTIAHCHIHVQAE